MKEEIAFENIKKRFADFKDINSAVFSYVFLNIFYDELKQKQAPKN